MEGSTSAVTQCLKTFACGSWGQRDEGVEARLVDDGKPSVRNVLTFKGSILER